MLAKSRKKEAGSVMGDRERGSLGTAWTFNQVRASKDTLTCIPCELKEDSNLS
jgi:hypothetical protein